MSPRPWTDGDEVVVVTGGSSGVGRASARAFADRGNPVAVLARGRASLDATVAELRERGVDALGISVDVTDRSGIDEAGDEIERTLGPVTTWVNSAMVTVFGPFQDLDPADFDRVVDVVFGGTANGTRTALRLMRPRNRGRVIQVSSALAYRGIPLQSAYCSAKHAVQGLSDSLRSELLHAGSAVTISEIHLPAVNTPQFRMAKSLMGKRPMPLPPIYQPELAATAIVEAAITGERSLMVTMSAARAIWGNNLLPGSMDRLLAEVGFDDQLTDEPVIDQAEHYLYEPLAGDHGCHGSFDDDAATSSPHEALRRSPIGRAAGALTQAGRRVSTPLLKRII